MGQKGMTINVRQGGQTLVPAPPEPKADNNAQTPATKKEK
jgi:hypothetical protein